MTRPDFRSRAMLLDRVARDLAFYHPGAQDPRGGFVQVFSNEGAPTDTRTRNLVSSCRFVFIHATAYRLFGRGENLAAARHGLAFLLDHHRVPLTGGYRWQFTFEDGRRSAEDTRTITYGVSFVILAHAVALKAGIAEARPWLDEIVATAERHLFEPDAGLYADEASADWSTVRRYRGQNANMHACEAMLAAFEATGDAWFLDRAETIAHAITVRQAGLAPLDAVWEHFKPDWSLDADYNRDDHSDGYRPWGYLAGHQTEWAKLLLMLDRHRPAAGRLDRARYLFDAAMATAWDRQGGGLFYSYGHDRALYDRSKQQWVIAETLAAAAHLAVRTGDEAYWAWYERLWGFAWDHLVDHEHGGWFRALNPDGSLASPDRGLPECDYHNIGACAEILTLLPA